MKQTVLVTGASGFIGGHLAKRLLEAGCAVVAQYRRAAAPAHLVELEARGARLIRADLTRREDLEKILAGGIHAVIHAAALASDWGPYRLFEQSNYSATVSLANAARARAVRRFIYISSVTVHGFGDHIDTDESGPYYPLRYPYPKTKKLAEEYVLSLNSKDFTTAVIRPGNVYGPGDTTTFYPMFRYIEKGFMGYVSGGKSLTCPIYIDDLVTGILAALGSDAAAGQIYNLTDGEKVAWKDLVDFLYGELGVDKKIINSPAWFSLCLAGILSFVYRLFRIKTAPPLTTYRIRQASHNYSFKIDKARRELCFSPQTQWQDGMRKTVQAYRREEAARLPRES